MNCVSRRCFYEERIQKAGIDCGNFSTESVMLVSMTEPFSSVNHTVTGGFDDED
ncbi:MAG: hypothetical protein ACLRX1_05310 [Ruminococcus sp.]